MTRVRLWAACALIVGLGALGWGIAWATNSDTPTCHGKEMSASDRCLVSYPKGRHGRTDPQNLSRDEVAGTDHRLAYALIGIGVLSVAAGAFLLWSDVTPQRGQGSVSS